MPTPTKGPRLGGTPAHQRIILANLASQLFEHGRITTTETKARRVQPLAETLITKAKRGDLHNRRLVARTISDKGVLHTLFAEIAPMLEGREGGYTRITKIGNRKGDNAPMAIIELVTETVEEGRAARAKFAKKSTKPAADAPSANEAEAAEAQAEGTVSDPANTPVDAQAEDIAADATTAIEAEEAQAEAATQEAVDAAAAEATDVPNDAQGLDKK